MPIDNESPITLPAQPEKILPHVWLYTLHAHAPSATSGTLRIDLRPCDANTGDIAGSEHNERLQVPFWKMISEVPEAAQAMQAVFDSIPAIREWAKSQNPETEIIP